jgi:hypothetical protein
MLNKLSRDQTFRRNHFPFPVASTREVWNISNERSNKTCSKLAHRLKFSVSLAFYRFIYIPSAFATRSPFHFKPGGYISKLLAASIPLIMVSRRGLSSLRRWQASMQRDKEERPRVKQEGPRQPRRSARISRLQRSGEDRA